MNQLKIAKVLFFFPKWRYFEKFGHTDWEERIISPHHFNVKNTTGPNAALISIEICLS